MTALEEARRLFAARQPQAAVARVQEGADGGDTEALCALANWRLFGLYGPRNPAEAHIFLDRAIALGHGEAARLKAALLASGTGCPRDDSASAGLLRQALPDDPMAVAQLQAWEALSGSAHGPVEILCEAPFIARVADVLPAPGCAYLMQLAAPRLRPSTVIDPTSGQRRPHPVRNSMGAGLGPDAEDLLVGLLNDRLAELTGTARHQGEPLHILRYEGPQAYRLHSDALPGEANQRDWTALVYLNDSYAGGETQFPALGLQVKGRRGEALLFRNVDKAGSPEAAARHAGLPATRGVKWIASRWIRRMPLPA